MEPIVAAGKNAKVLNRTHNIVRALVSMMCLLFMAQSGLAKTSSDDISVKILNLHQRTGKRMTPSEGILEIRFYNSSAKTLSIVFKASAGKGLLIDEPQSYFQSDENGTYSSGGDFSELEYEWINKKGIKCLSDSYGISHESVVLKGGEYHSIAIPIHIPQEPGSYRLKIHFDNSVINGLLMPYNIGKFSKERIFFQASDEVNLEILPTSVSDSKCQNSFIEMVSAKPKYFRWEDHDIVVDESWLHKLQTGKNILLIKLKIDSGLTSEDQIANKERKLLFFEPSDGKRVTHRSRFVDISRGHGFQRIYCIELPDTIPKEIKLRVETSTDNSYKIDTGTEIVFKIND